MTDEQFRIEDDDVLDLDPSKEVKPEETVDSLKLALKELEGKFTEERRSLEREKMEAFRQASDARRLAETRESEAREQRKLAAEARKETATRSIDGLKADIHAALDAGDYAKLADLQVKLAETVSKADRLGEDLERQAAQPKPPSQEQQRAPSLEEAFNQVYQGSSSHAKDYLAARKAQIKSVEDLQDLYATHERAVRRGMQIDSPEYFEYLDSRMGYEGEPHAAKQADGGRQAKPKAKPSYAAPPSRGGDGDLSGGNGSVVTLTREQAEFAQSMGMSPSAYAKNVAAIKKGQRRADWTGPRFSTDIFGR